jgi:hypothetical protein
MADLRTKLPLVPIAVPKIPKVKRVACSGDTPHDEVQLAGVESIEKIEKPLAAESSER